MNLLNRIFNHCIDFFYPHICLVCGDKITLDYSTDRYDKTKPSSNIHIISTEFCCSVCKSKIIYAHPKEKIILSIIPYHSDEEIAISNAVALFENNPDILVMNLIYQLKYFGYKRIGIEYGEMLGEKIINENLGDYDFIVPVPIHKTKKKERGYNQSDYIAQGVNNILKKTIKYDLIKRIRYTPSQTTLTLEGRLTNVKGVFEINKKYNLEGKNILLIDDVLTTGSTLNNCAYTLISNNARKVDVATLLMPDTSNKNYFN
jgi:ComF family protein